MSERGVVPEREPQGESMPAWLMGLGALAAVLVVAVLLAVVVPAVREQRSAARSTENAGTAAPTTAPQDDAGEVTTTTGPPVAPAGLVAYVDAAGQVLVGDGADPPEVIAADAAIGDAGLGAVAIAPTGDVVAYARNDGALVLASIPVVGVADPPVVIATDVALEAIGATTSLAWDFSGSLISYLAVGTDEMVEPRTGEPPPLSAEAGVYRVPLPEGVLGNVVKVVDREGAQVVRIGDPSTRSMVGVTMSSSDDLMLLESVAPDTGKPYTLSLATTGSAALVPTVLSGDDPAFAPDGSFAVAVWPDRGGVELVRVATETLDRASLSSGSTICRPSVSPDSTRIVYGAGEDCSELHLISARGGVPVDITPPTGPGDVSFGVGALGWTQDGHHVVFSSCAATSGPVGCEGPVTFLDPDRREVVEGFDAATVAPQTRPLIRSLRLDLAMEGPIEYETSFDVSTELEGQLTEVGDSATRIDAELVEDDRTLTVDLQVQEGATFATGTIAVSDPDAGIDRTFLVLARPTVLGVRSLSLSGMWISTDELPVTSGEFRLAIRRR
jgi:hypothetical protein